MKTSRFFSPRCLLFAATVIPLCTRPAHAAGTLAGTVIGNQATVRYMVSGSPQPDIMSPSAVFVVDRKINLTVVTNEIAAVSVALNSTANVLRFTVGNTGNGTQDFSLSSRSVILNSQAARFGNVPTKIASGTMVRVESGQTVGYQPSEDTAAYIDELAPDGVQTVYLLGDFVGTYNNGEIASYHLLAEARQGGTPGGSVGMALTQNTGADSVTEDIVFADGLGSDEQDETARDAKYSDFADYKVSTGALLTLTKTSAVISDPVNGTTNPKALPGAVVEYTITVTNADGAPMAENVNIDDDLMEQIIANTAMFLPDAYGPGKGIQFTSTMNGGMPLDLTSDLDGDAGQFMANRVSVRLMDPLFGGQSATVKFRVLIK